MSELIVKIKLDDFVWGKELDKRLEQNEIKRQKQIREYNLKNRCHCCGNIPRVNQFGL